MSEARKIEWKTIDDVNETLTDMINNVNKARTDFNIQKNDEETKENKYHEKLHELIQKNNIIEKQEFIIEILGIIIIMGVFISLITGFIWLLPDMLINR